MASGQKVPEDLYTLKMEHEGENVAGAILKHKPDHRNISSYDEQPHCKRIRSSPEGIEVHDQERRGDIENGSPYKVSNTQGVPSSSPHTMSSITSSPEIPSTPDKDVRCSVPMCMFYCVDFGFLFLQFNFV